MGTGLPKECIKTVLREQLAWLVSKEDVKDKTNNHERN